MNVGIPSEKEAFLQGKRKQREVRYWRGENYTQEIKNFLSKESVQPIIYLEEKDEVKSKINFCLFSNLRTISWFKNY